MKKALGYTSTDAEELIENIRENVDKFNAIEKPENGYGKRYELIMKLIGKNGKTANVLTAWIDDVEKDEMRLVSVYVDK